MFYCLFHHRGNAGRINASVGNKQHCVADMTSQQLEEIFGALPF